MSTTQSPTANLRQTAATAPTAAPVPQTATTSAQVSASVSIDNVRHGRQLAALKSQRDKYKRSSVSERRRESDVLKFLLDSDVMPTAPELAEAAYFVARTIGDATHAEVRAWITPCASGDNIARLDEIVRGAFEMLENVKTMATAEDFEINAKTMKPDASPRNYDVALAKLGVTFRYDEFARRKFMERDGVQRIVEDSHLDDLRVEIDQEFGLRGEKDYFRDLVGKRARENAYHPVRDYFDGLRWDGVARLDTWVIDCAGAEDTPYARAVSSLPILAAVKRVQSPGAKFDEMLILQGDQGVAKSSALKALCPVESWFTDSLPLDGDIRTVLERTRGKLIVEAPELKGMGKADRNALKAMLSRSVDEARGAYQREDSIVPRQFVMIGTINDETYLSDATGARRYWPVKVRAFDLGKIVAMRDQLWAEACARVKAGESIRLDPSLYEAASEAQDAATETNLWASVLGEHLRNIEGRIRDVDLLRLLGIEVAKLTSVQGRDLSTAMTAMKRLGWKKYRNRRTGTDTDESGYERGASKERIEVDGGGLIPARVKARGKSAPTSPTSAPTN